ncbi:hypothetical protein M3Y96_00394900 [Aphelenchoides besseyi]|nr:hypothetical protein M3Y96_00394900 [Aphelenchoides besseyi]
MAEDIAETLSKISAQLRDNKDALSELKATNNQILEELRLMRAEKRRFSMYEFSNGLKVNLKFGLSFALGVGFGLFGLLGVSFISTGGYSPMVIGIALTILFIGCFYCGCLYRKKIASCCQLICCCRCSPESRDSVDIPTTETVPEPVEPIVSSR